MKKKIEKNLQSSGLADLQTKRTLTPNPSPRGRGGKSAFTLAEGATHVGIFDNCRRAAFTLAEVLITLAIIGVVAAMTIPTLIQNYQKKVTITKIQQNLSLFSNGLKLMIVNEGCTDSLNCNNLFSATIDDEYYNRMDKAIRSAFKVVASSKGTTELDYTVKPLHLTTVNFKNADKGLKAGYYTSINNRGGYQFILQNGAQAVISNRQCIANAHPESSQFKERCGDIFFDINSNAEPNEFGRDIFSLTFDASGNIYPINGIEFAKAFSGEEYESSIYWWKNDGGNGRNCHTTSQSSGFACLARLMENDWKFDY